MFEEKLTGRVARFADRREDWSVFGFETARDPRYARAQRRYLGASGSTDPKDLRGAIPATAFTMSIQTMPAGNRIPIHCHETEEVFFILEGECLVRCHYVRNMPTPSYWSFKRPGGEALGTRWNALSIACRCAIRATPRQFCS
jgi:hypothetical protein